ncbi:MAG: glycosyltransferase [Solirubrobacterales bacterium]
MRLAVYTDFSYHRDGSGELWASEAFGVFVSGLAGRFDRLVLIGRHDPSAASARHRLPPGVEFEPLPHYSSLRSLGGVASGALGSVRAFWRTLAGVDAVWLMGPHPFSVLFAGLARLRGRRVILGVRQDTAAYMGERYRDRPAFRAAGRMLELTYRLLSRRFAVVVVGPALARSYRGARRLLSIVVSLVEPEDLCDPREVASRDYGGELTVLSVGRLDPEKNPLLAADILAGLDGTGRWRLAFCGEGPLRDELARRLDAAGLGDRSELLGYVPYRGGLRELYRGSHFLLLTSWTEGLPQVALEAFAAGLPVVTTRVGGLPEAAPDAIAAFPAGSAEEGAARLAALAADAAARERQVAAGLSWARLHTASAEADRIAAFFGAV